MDLQSGVTTKAYTLSPATSGETYSFRVQARNSVGYSDDSNTLEIIAATEPGAPTNLVQVYSLITTDQVSFNWSAPEDDEGVPILDYTVELYDETAGNFKEVATATETSYTQTGLQENTSYKFRVRAKNSIGYGEFSSETSIATLMETIGTIS